MEYASDGRAYRMVLTVKDAAHTRIVVTESGAPAAEK
jgi:hypothetical protein